MASNNKKTFPDVAKERYNEHLGWHTFIDIFSAQKQQNFKVLYFTLGSICAFFLLFALGMEYIGGFKPCAFCVYERWPYVGVFLFALLAAFSCKPGQQAVWGSLIVAAFFVEVGLSLYHVAIEHHWVTLPEVCGGSAFSEKAIFEELKQAILATDIVPCDRVPISLFGFSMVEYNLFVSFLLTIYSTFVAIRNWAFACVRKKL